MARAKSRKQKSSKKSSRSQQSAYSAPAMTSSLKKDMSSSEAAAMSVTQLSAMYGAFLLANMLVVWGASLLAPNLVVLGTSSINAMAAAFYSMIVLTSILVGATPLIESIINTLRLKVSNLHWMVGFFALNILGVWVVGRFAEELGLGIAAWWVAVALAFVMNVVQGLIVVQGISKIKA
jgi:CBS domain containing-hemolysin-like protein